MIWTQSKLVKYINSPSTKFSLCIGALMYASYAASHDAWSEPALIGVSAFVAGFMPLYARASNKLEERVNFLTAFVTAGRLARFAAQLAFNYVALWILESNGALIAGGIESVGGVLSAAIITTAASQGAQYVGIFLFNRGFGDMTRNVQVGLSANIVATALATAGLPIAREFFLIAGIGLGIIVFGIGALSDLRSLVFPRRGIGVFFGTFNPFHKTHMALIHRALEERRLERIYIHPTLVPKFHRTALERGEIKIARTEGGLRVMERTKKADANVNYFPTGNRYFAPETRKELIRLAVDESGLGNRVEVSFFPQDYDDHGFHGVLRRIRALNPSQPIHGIHGSDFGGMAVRAILDECGWIYPMAVRRRDSVSATAIRDGAAGMTTRAVGSVLDQLKQGNKIIAVNTVRFMNDEGVLKVVQPAE